jgi:protein-L-isoaspartate(D-aspartate) O-methyltransferase
MTFDVAAARQTMVDTQVRVNDVTDISIQAAMRRVPREAVCPPDKAFLAYADAEVEYAPGRWLLRPRDAAKLLQAVRPRAGETALAIAAPYLALVLEDIGLAVTRLDGEELKTFPAGVFDVIVCEGAVGVVPPAWPAALAIDGRLGVVVRDGPVGKMRLYARTQRDLGYREVFDATPPVLAGLRPEPGFAF